MFAEHRCGVGYARAGLLGGGNGCERHCGTHTSVMNSLEFWLWCLVRTVLEQMDMVKFRCHLGV